MPTPPPRKPFISRVISLVLIAFAFSLAGVLAVDLYIEHRQQEASSHVAVHTFESLRAIGRFSTALAAYEQTALGGRPNGDTQAALLDSRGQLVDAMKAFEPHLGPPEKSTWDAIRGRLLALEDTIPLGPPVGEVPTMELRQRFDRIFGDVAAMSDVVDGRGIVSLRESEALHDVEGALEAGVLAFMAAGSVLLLVVWRRAELEARRRDVATEAQLRRAVADLDAFAGRIAHDLRNPLVPILANSQRIERAPVPDAVRGHAERIERSARRLGTMIDALLQFARLGNAGRGGGATRLDDAVEDVLADLQEAARARGARIESDLGFGGDVACHPEVVRSVVQNLVDNALKHGAVGERPPEIAVRTRAEGPAAVVEVEDRGPGVPVDQRERVFEPMVRGQTLAPGAGLGLSIVKRMVDMAGGRIELTGAARGGALFRVSLPRSGAPPSSSPGGPERPRPSSGLAG